MAGSSTTTQAPAATASWDYQAVVDSLFDCPPHSEGGEGAPRVVCSSAPLKTVLLLQPVRSQTERQHSRAGRGEKKASLDRLLPVSTEERGFCQHL